LPDNGFHKRLFDAIPLIEQICSEEGATVTLTGSNPDFNDLPNEAVTVCNSATGWIDQTFRADTIADCLGLVLKAEPIEHEQAIANLCTGIADKVEPDYRTGAPRSCTGYIARRWQAAWDGACLAIGGDPASYRRT
jgi:hypothetical protein